SLLPWESRHFPTTPTIMLRTDPAIAERNHAASASNAYITGFLHVNTRSKNHYGSEMTLVHWNAFMQRISSAP
ncbi:hypothetical protein, partial [Halobacillus alkaliphilus]|uniref:hypothetical protein n=1 Tax=Halobacillus alkaliphilus TaxID=396056 RepID=UPI001C317A1E